MIAEEGNPCTVIYYLTCFRMLGETDVGLLCAYKQFVESTIIELGEDWRIESGLLSQQIVSILTQQMAQAQSPLSQRLQFNIFNQLLLPFLLDKMGKQQTICTTPDSQIQQQYSSQLGTHFYHNSKITDSLTFKTLSLGFCIKAVDTWVKEFQAIHVGDYGDLEVEPLGVLWRVEESREMDRGNRSSNGASTIRNNFSNMDIGSCQQSNSEANPKKTTKQVTKKWMSLKSLSQYSEQELHTLKSLLSNFPHKKTQVISNFAVHVHELQTATKRTRVMTTNSQFYRRAFIVWLIFNIKLFFSITFQQYLVYFKKLLHSWQPSLEQALRKFYTVIEKEWALLLKDYSVALHDDLEVLRSLIKRVRGALREAWRGKCAEICQKFVE